MAYILSTDNRFYVALETSYGNAGAAASANRIPAIKLTAKQRTEKVQRKDKTGSRTFAGYPSGLRRETSFELRTYMTTWTDTTSQPPYGPLFEACMGAPALQWNGALVASTPDASKITFATPHGLIPGQAVTSGGEIRFVSAIVDAQTVQLNAPLTNPPMAGMQTGPTVVYQLATNLKSISLFDYWSPSTSVQRIVSGAAVDALSVIVNGDFHEFRFAGPARDLVDNSTFESGQSGLSSYPPEPGVDPLNYSIIPGHLGQVWLGSSPDRFFTLTKAEVSFQNNVDLRAREFGLDLATAISPGVREASIDFSLYQQDDAATAALYQAARQQSPISVMIQLGQQEGQLFAIYMKSVMPEVPAFDDSERRQQWQFQSCRAQGSIDDEIIVAFG